MSKLLSDEAELFFVPTAEELQAEQSKYGNIFMNLRKKQIKQALNHSQKTDELMDKFNTRMAAGQGTTQYSHLLDKHNAEGQQNIDEIHSRYGHLLDKYIK